MRGHDLKPRAVAVLCALRNGPLTSSQIRKAIGDERKSGPSGLLASMRSAPLSLVTQIPRDDRWYLTHEGIGWLQQNGLDAVREARLYVAQEAVST